MDGDDEVQAGEDRREAGDEDAERRRDDVGRRRDGAERRVERPAGVDAAGDERVEREQAAEDVDVPAREVQLREREILRADHDRHEEVAEHGRDRRDEEEEHHHHAVHREQLVVGLVGHEVAGRRRELEADQHRERAADEEEERDRGEIEQRDALVIARQQPRLDAVAVVQVVARRKSTVLAWLLRHGLPSPWPTWRHSCSCSDFTYSISSSSCSSLTSPWKVGMIGWKPAATFAAGFRIDSRT